jgi:hypothetical protein
MRSRWGGARRHCPIIGCLAASQQALCLAAHARGSQLRTLTLPPQLMVESYFTGQNIMGSTYNGGQGGPSCARRAAVAAILLATPSFSVLANRHVE